ncbi:MAG TPA: hypothetical protein VNY75_06770 [Rhizomicrobium sp.]|jgi:hypothetical protein|nr:hypothetical protein [Rhizomicrobium sp.]
MKYLILAAGLSLIAAPAFAASAQDAAGKQQTAMTASAPQQHSYSYNSDEGGSIAARNARLQRNAAERSPNAKAAWAGQAHFY